MNIQEAILAFAQSEKIKAGLIWISQGVDFYAGLSESDKPGAVKVIRMMLDRIYNDVHLAGKLCHDDSWRHVEEHMDMAMVMIDSRVVQESTFHLTRALSRLTSIGQRSMTVLRENGLI